MVAGCSGKTSKSGGQKRENKINVADIFNFVTVLFCNVSLFCNGNEESTMLPFQHFSCCREEAAVESRMQEARKLERKVGLVFENFLIEKLI